MDSGSVGGKIQVNDSELFPTEESYFTFFRRHPKVELVASVWTESGPVQSFLLVATLDELERLLDDVAVTRAAATTGLHIIRKRPAMHREVHCPQLVERAVHAANLAI